MPLEVAVAQKVKQVASSILHPVDTATVSLRHFTHMYECIGVMRVFDSMVGEALSVCPRETVASPVCECAINE